MKRDVFTDNMYYGTPSSSFSKARDLRSNMTDAERILWEQLKDKNIFKNHKFRRQHLIHIFIADFYCHSSKLVIEVDEEYHNDPEQEIKDVERTKIINDLDVIRFTNDEVFYNIEAVIAQIKEYIDKKTTSQ